MLAKRSHGHPAGSGLLKLGGQALPFREMAATSNASGYSAPAPASQPRLIVAGVVVLYACATLQFVRFYTVSAAFYLNLPAYLSGHERLPFQYRILPALLIRALYATHLLHATGMHNKGAFTAERAPLYVISLVSLVVAGLCTQAIYNTLSRTRPLQLLVYPVFLFTMMWTYSIHVEANFSYPYDMLSVAFFAAGLLCIVRRKFLPLVAVAAVGTLNRETTLFLIGLYLLDAASASSPQTSESLAERFHFRQVPWIRAGVLFGVWLAIRVALARHFAGNDNTENYVRLHDNLRSLKPRLWPALLNVCGYMLPVVLLLQRDLWPRRFRNYLWIVPFWFAVMLYAGVIVETRIYGELCPYVAVALVLIVEHRLTVRPGPVTLKPLG